ncbi:TerC family protein [Brevibacillus daliensis]|uniref:TerC family protein n=1 Tax=Brevibacillus daliensis TaxID=2892995 RepID=UPI001E2853E1|nr:TerC family protein [Brevibacillus daliensis]
MIETEFITALLMIIAIDILLGGDNAVVIAMASRNLPKDQKRSAILWGTGMAICIRIIATLVAAYLLKVPFLFFIGGLLLTYIAYKLLAEEEHDPDIKGSTTLRGAIQTIVIADMTMGIDNVVAVAGTAKGDMLLIIIGLVVSIPIIVWGSALILKAMERYTWIPFVGAGILALAAAKMITHEQQFAGFYTANPWVDWVIKIVIIGGVLGAGIYKRSQSKKQQQKQEVNVSS